MKNLSLMLFRTIPRVVIAAFLGFVAVVWLGDANAVNAQNRKIKLDLKPTAPLAQLILDGGFETGGIPNTFWNPETSTNFGTPLCDVPSCGTAGGASAPRTGAFWAWFGGIPAPETATLGQTVAIPNTLPNAQLGFWMCIGTVNAPFTDVLNVRVNGTIVATYPEPAVAEAAYTFRHINMTPYVGTSPVILFEYIGPTSGTGSYVIDDVSLITYTAPTAAAVSVSGRVMTANGAGLKSAVITLTDQGGRTRTTLTSSFGYYRFDDVVAGETCVIGISSKRYQFAAQVVSVVDDITGLDFVAESVLE